MLRTAIIAVRIIPSILKAKFATAQDGGSFDSANTGNPDPMGITRPWDAGSSPKT